MTKNTIKKFIVGIFMTVMMIVIASFACMAYEVDKSVFDQVGSDRESLKEISAAFFDNAEKTRHDYLFLGKDNYIPTKMSDGVGTIASELFDSELLLSDKDVFIAFSQYENNYDDDVIITFRYECEDNDAAIAFMDATKKIKDIPQYINYRIEKNDDGYTVLKMRLSKEQLADLAYYTGDNVTVLEPVCDNGKITVNSISIEQKKGGYNELLIMESDDTCESSMAVVSFDSDKSNAVIMYEKNDEKLELSSEKDIEFCMSDTVDDYELSFNGNACSDASVVADVELNETVDSNAEIEKCETEAGNTDDDSDEIGDDISEIDIEERDYMSLEDDCSSAIYTDGYAYVDSSATNNFKTKSGIIGSDAYLNVYTESKGVGSGNSLVLSNSDLLGSNYEDMFLYGDIMAVKVANIRDCEYAGHMEIVLDSESEDSGQDGFDITASSDAAEEASDETDTRAFLSSFGKSDGEIYARESDSNTLTEAFLKKASYCAVDADGIVCALYNEHGRLAEIAEGYTEDDIAAFILVPELSDADIAAEIGIADVTVTYNDILCAEDNYAVVVHSDSEGNIVEPTANASVFIDSDMMLDLTIDVNSKNQTIIFSGNLTDTEFLVNAADEYNVMYTVEKANESSEDEDGTAEETAGRTVEETSGETIGDGAATVIEEDETSIEETKQEESAEETAEVNNGDNNETTTEVTGNPPDMADEDSPGDTIGNSESSEDEADNTGVMSEAPPGAAEHAKENVSSNISKTIIEMAETPPPNISNMAAEPPPPQE